MGSGMVWMTMVIRPPHTTEKDTLHALWERSVRATHVFLTEEDIRYYSPMVREALASDMEFWVAADGEKNEPLGFAGLARDRFGNGWKLEALFVDPAASRKGVGSLLVRHSRLLKGELTLDVNEQNPDALAFYRRIGFAETGRSPLDGSGRPFPLIHMRG